MINIRKTTPESLNSHEICFLSKQSQLEANAVVRKAFLLFHEQVEKFCQKTKCISFSSSLLDLVVCIIFGRRVVQATSQSINFMVQSRQSKVCQIQFKKDLDISNTQNQGIGRKWFFVRSRALSRGFFATWKFKFSKSLTVWW